MRSRFVPKLENCFANVTEPGENLSIDGFLILKNRYRTECQAPAFKLKHRDHGITRSVIRQTVDKYGANHTIDSAIHCVFCFRVVLRIVPVECPTVFRYGLFHEMAKVFHELGLSNGRTGSYYPPIAN